MTPSTFSPVSGFKRIFIAVIALPACIALWSAPRLAAAAALEVDTDFPGGSVQVLEIDQQARRIRFTLRDHETRDEWACWWYLKVSGITPGETLKLSLEGARRAIAGRAVYSTDGTTWNYTQAEGEAPAPTYVQQVDAEQAWFAWYVPFLPVDAERVVSRAAESCAAARKFVLCQSEAGIPVHAITFAEPGVDEADRFGVWVLARQHAWEVGGSWTAKGLIDWLASDDERAADLRRRASVTVVPLVDVDSVSEGRGGKNQRPHDHNRDWMDNPYWRSTRAAMAELKPLDAAGRLDLLIDLHDPGWSGNVQFWCHAYRVMQPLRKRNTDLFLAAAAEEIVGPLRFDGKPTVRYAVDTPTAGIWGCTRTREGVVGGTFEIGVAPPRGYAEPPPAHHLELGKQLGLAFERYLRHDIRAEVE